MTLKIVNLTKQVHQVDVLVPQANGTMQKQAVGIYERAQLPLPEGTVVCNNWLVRNPRIIKVINTATYPASTSASAATEPTKLKGDEHVDNAKASE